VKLALVYTGCFRSGGVERIVLESARELGRRHDVTVFADYWEDCGTPEVDYVRVAPRKRPRALLPFSFARRSARAIAAGRFDRVVSYGVNCAGGDVLWVNSVHRAWLEQKSALRLVRPADRALLELERRRYRQRDYQLLLAVSDRVADDLARLYGVPREDVRVVPNGFAPEEFSPARRAALRPEARRRLGLAEGEVAFLIVANELRRKGLHVLCEAVDRLDDPRVRILLAGGVEPPPHPRVRWLGRLDDVAWAHAAADVFTLPTQYEAACLAIVEALGSGLPVITTSVPGAADHVVDGVTGLLQHDPLDADELVALLRRALDRDTRNGWSAAAAPSVAALQWPRILAGVEELLGAGRRRLAA
jgi:glycosyltransferase involved in cell wall biosynthesis